MTMITIGARVRDLKTGLAGKVTRIFSEVRPHTDLVIIRYDKPNSLYGSIGSAFVGEVEVLEGETGIDRA